MSDQHDDEPAGDIMYLWKIPIDRGYVKSLVSLLKVVLGLLSLIAFICAASGRTADCDHAYASTYNFFEFTSISSFLTIFTLWFFFTLTLDRRICFKLLPWRILELVYLAIYAIFFLIASITIAAQACGKDSNKAASAFGFFSLAVVGVHIFFTFKDWRKGGHSSGSATTAGPNGPQYDADTNRQQQY